MNKKIFQIFVIILSLFFTINVKAEESAVEGNKLTSFDFFAGDTESVILKEDGTIWRWGHFYRPTLKYALTPEKVENFSDIVKIPDSLDTYIVNGAIKADGSLWVWGRNDSYQLGLETKSSVFSNTPIQINIPTKIVDAVLGTNSIALDENGNVWTWGENDYGQIGDGTAVWRYTPYKVEGLTDIVQVVSTGENSHALDSKGQVWSWGRSFYGETGDELTTHEGPISEVKGGQTGVNRPIKAVGLPYVKKISAKRNAILAIDEYGDLWTWGRNSNFQIKGDNSLFNILVPTKVVGLSEVVDVSLENSYAIALKSDGSLWSWGYNRYAILGDGVENLNQHKNPSQVLVNKKIVAFSTSKDHVLAVDEDGQMWSWGDDYHRQLGTHPHLHPFLEAKYRQSNRITVPQVIEFLNPIQTNKELLKLKEKEDLSIKTKESLFAGDYESLVLKENGTVWRWGNFYHPRQIYSLYPEKIELVNQVVKIPETLHTGDIQGVIKENGSLWVWGRNEFFQLGLENKNTNLTTIPVQIQIPTKVKDAVLGTSSIALDENGEVWTWGDNKRGLIADGTSEIRKTPYKVEELSNIVQIASSGLTHYALDSSGQVWAWGQNNFKAVGNDSAVGYYIYKPVKSKGLSNIKMVSAKENAALAVDENGNVWTWGNTRNFDIAGDGTLSTYSPIKAYGLSNAVKVSLESYYAVILKEDGTLWAWGVNHDSILGNGEVNRIINPPTKVLIDKKIVDFSTSNNHVLAVDEDGNIWSWGYDYHRKLGTYPYLFNNSAQGNYPDKEKKPLKIEFIALNGEDTKDSYTPVLSGLNASERVTKKDYKKVQQSSLEADPIDTSTGALISSNTMLSTKGEVPLKFSINYNSLVVNSNILGNGWYHNHFGRIKTDGDTLKYYTDSNSHSDFKLGADGKYYNEDKKYYIKHIEKTFTGYVLYYKNGSSLRFNNDGLLIESKKVNELISYIYNEDKLIKIVQTVNHQETVFELEYQNNLISKVSYEGKSISFTYDSKSNLIETTDLNGNKTNFEYNDKSQIVKSKNAKGSYNMINDYDEFGRIVKQLDGNGNATLFEYKENDHGKSIETKVTSREGFIRTLYHNDKYELLKEVNSNQEESTNRYDSKGNLIETVDYSGLVTKFEYDESSNLVKTIDHANRIEEFSYDENNNLISIKDIKGNITSYEYNSDNLMIKATTPRGVVTNIEYLNGLIVKETTSLGTESSYSYDGSLISKKVDSEGNETSYSYENNKRKVTDPKGNIFIEILDNNNNIIKSINPYNEEVIYEYDGLNQLIKTTYPNGLIENLEYDLNGNVIKKTVNNSSETYSYNKEDQINFATSQNGNSTVFEYNSLGLLIKEINQEGLVVEYKYDSSKNLVEKKTEDRIYKYNYNEAGLLTSEVDPEGKTTTYSYDEYDRLTSSKNAKEGITRYEYDELDYLIKEIDANGNSISYEYDSFGNKTKVIDSKGNATQFKYDKLNNLIKITDNQENETTFGYDKKSNLIKETNSLRNSTTYVYDKLDRVVETVNPLGNKTTVAYDNMGNISSIKDANNNTVSKFTYNLKGDILSVEDALGNVTSYEYDKESNLTKTVDALNRETKHEYNSYSLITKTVDAAGVSSTNSYNSFGELIGYKDPNTNQTTYTYNKLGLVTKELNATNNELTYEYDDLHLLKKSTNARGNSISYEYDKIGNLLKETSPESVISYEYDSNYNLIKTTEKNISTNVTKTILREYDSLNRLTQYTDSFGNKVKYQYDSVGNILSITYPDGKVVAYKYDAANNLTEVSDWNNQKTTYSYDKNNRLIKTVNSNGTYEERKYDLKGQVVNITHYKASGEVLEALNYSYDKVGNLVAENDKNYVYDSLNRVISANGKEYSYDAAGNILEVSNPTTSGDSASIATEDLEPIEEENSESTITEDSASISTPNSVQFTYAEDNRLNTYQEQTMNLDKDGNLLSIPTNNGLSEGVYNSRNQLVSLGDTKYTYDAEGRRVSISNGSVDSRFIYNPNSRLDQLLMETDSNGQPIAYYVYGLGLISQESYAGVKSTYHFDKRGSTLFLTDESGNKTNEYSYDVYGEILTSEGETFNRFLYNGKYGVQADDSGLYFMRNRYYSPEIKRFINRDVIQGNINEPQTFNRFAYVNGNPLNYIDPFGLSKESDSQSNQKWETGLNVLQGVLSVGGFVPVFGEAFDLINAVISLGRGNYADAALHAASAIPIAGNAVAVGKVAYKAGKAGDKALDLKKATKENEACPRNCFVLGTLVLTKEGYIPVEDIDVGDLVLAKDDETGEVQYKEVLSLFNREADVIFTIRVGEEEISVTGEHPFWVEGKGWVETADLVVGDKLTTYDGHVLPISDIVIKEEVTTVYNFEVDEFHTYFVSKIGVWTHNCVGSVFTAQGYATKTLDKIKVDQSIVKSSDSPSKILRNQLKQNGVTPPPYAHAAHHIVAEKHPSAQRSREILDEMGIEYNSAANGVFLPYQKNSFVGDESMHVGNHGPEYYQYVNEVLSQVQRKYGNSAVEGQKALNKIREGLLNGSVKLN